MKHLTIDGKLGKFNVNLPENLNEVGDDYLNKCAEFITPAPNYAVIALIYKDSLSLLLSSNNKKKETRVNVIPVFIKAGVTDSEFIKDLHCGDKIIVAGSDLSIAHHVVSPYNRITPANIIAISQGDKNVFAKAMTFTGDVCFVEFKVAPINCIHGKLENINSDFVNPFINRPKEEEK